MMPDAVRYLLSHYTEICEQMTGAIRRDGRPQKVFYLALGMSRATFDRRMRRNDWRPEELGVLVGMVGGNDLESNNIEKAKENLSIVDILRRWLS